MWRRNLLFAAVIVGGGASLSAALFPPALPPLAKHFDPADFEAAEFNTVVSRINADFRAQWSEEGLQPAPRAPELTIARRLSLGLTGRIPSLQEIRQFQMCEQTRRLPRYLAALLEDRRFADYLGERLARAFVGTEDGPFILYRRRRFVSWLSDELMKKRPYDELVRAIIASDGLWTDTPATNFITVTCNPAMNNRPDAERLAGRVTRAFLGMRIDCAQCHNHPFDKWQQADFRGLAAYFGQVREGFTGTRDDKKVELELANKRGEMQTVAPCVPFQPELVPGEGNRRQQLAAWVTHPRIYFARAIVNRVWALMLGRPLVDPVDEMSSADEPPRLMQILADDFVAHGHDLRRLIRVIAATEAFQIDSAAPHVLTEAHEKGWAAFRLTRLRPEQVVGGVLQAASLATINNDSPLLVKLFTTIGEHEFVKHYGDTGEDEFGGRGGTIPQALLRMNGKLVWEKTKQEIFNAAARIAWQASDDRIAVETAYLAVLTRPPTRAEAEHFQARLASTHGDERGRRVEDLYWALINSTEFSWNH